MTSDRIFIESWEDFVGEHDNIARAMSQSVENQKSLITKIVELKQELFDTGRSLVFFLIILPP